MKLNSLQRPCSWVWSEDPALDGPDYLLAPKREAFADDAAFEEASKAWAEKLSEWKRRLNTAQDTGQWDGLVKAGQKLTFFELRMIPEATWRALVDAVAGSTVGIRAGNALVVRLALRSTSNLDGYDGKPYVVDLRSEGSWGQIATEEVTDLLAAYYRELVRMNPDREVSHPIDEMANFIARRQGGLRPLS